MRRSVTLLHGLLLGFGQNIDAEMHQHNLWQLCLALEPYGLNDEKVIGANIVEPNQRHKLSMTKGWVILAEPESRVGEVLADLPRQFGLIEGDLDDWRSLLARQTALPAAFDAQQLRPSHKKIQSLVAHLDECFGQQCIKPGQWRAEQVASDLALSESRFLHLVKEQLGMPWRPYLLWRRLLCAIAVLKQGQSATDAAYIAGFSDVAHLSRTIKTTFGMTSKQLLASFAA